MKNKTNLGKFKRNMMNNKKINKALLITGAIVLPVFQPSMLMAQTGSCTTLGSLITEAGANIRNEFRDSPAVVASAVDNDCRVLLTEINDRGGLVDVQSGQSDSVTKTVEVEQQATIEGSVNVTLPDPEVNIEQDPAEVSVTTLPPQVNVTPGQPIVRVRQAAPIITIDMPKPTITIEQPAPEITVIMPEPGVDVTNAQPRIEVVIPRPRVTVRQGEPSLSVNLDATPGANLAANAGNSTVQRSDLDGVMTVTAEGLNAEQLAPTVQFQNADENADITIGKVTPEVEYISAEPDVRITQDGEPTIELIQSGEPKVMVKMSDDESTVDALEQRDPKAAFALGSDETLNGDTRSISVSEISGMDVINARGEELGEVSRVVRNGQSMYVIVEHGGWFFGINDKEVALPVDDVVVQNGKIVLRGLTEEQIEAMPDYDYAAEAIIANEDMFDVRIAE